MPSHIKSPSRHRIPSHKKAKSLPTHSGAKKSSVSKDNWVKLLNNADSKQMLKKVWSSKNPQQEYKKTIEKIASKIKK